MYTVYVYRANAWEYHSTHDTATHAIRIARQLNDDGFRVQIPELTNEDAD